jgi:protoporphyrinogen oxidase
MSQQSDSKLILDVAIVGGGPGGMGTAYALRDLADAKIKVFERTHEVGGRTQTRDVEGFSINTGALFVYEGTRSAQLCSELGVDWLPVEPKTFAVHVNGETVVSEDSEEVAENLPMDPEAREDFLRVVRLMRETYAKYGGRDMVGSEEIADVTLAEFLGPLHPDAAALVEASVIAAVVGKPDELSAQYGLRYFASYLAQDPASRGLISDGMQEICKKIHARLADDVVRLETAVESVEQLPDGNWELQVRSGDEVETYVARNVVMAVPGPSVERLVPGLPEWKKEAIAKVATPSAATLAVVLDCTDRPAWEDLFVIFSVGTKFQCATQPRTGPSFLPREENKTYFMLNREHDPVETLRGYDTETFTNEMLEDFYKVLPDAKGRVLSTHLTRWEECFAFPQKDRAEMVPLVREEVDGSMYFVGDYTSLSAGSHGAYGEADRVAADLREKIAPGVVSGAATNG